MNNFRAFFWRRFKIQRTQTLAASLISTQHFFNIFAAWINKNKLGKWNLFTSLNQFYWHVLKDTINFLVSYLCVYFFNITNLFEWESLAGFELLVQRVTTFCGLSPNCYTATALTSNTIHIALKVELCVCVYRACNDKTHAVTWTHTGYSVYYQSKWVWISQ